MRDIWTLDSETDPFKVGRVPAPFLWGLYNGQDYRTFTNTDKIARFIKKNVDGIVYAHNGGKFDYHFMIHHAEAYDEMLIINGRIARWRLGNAEMRDSMNILPVPLADYKKDEIDYSIMEASERNKPRNRAIIEEYLRDDCVYLHELVTGFIDRYGLSITQAAASMKLWLKTSGISLPDTGHVFFDTFKPFYYGGRVQAFKRGVGRGTFHLIDRISAYPAEMLGEHPFGTEYERSRSQKVVRQDFYVVDAVARGCFPWREGLKLEFPEDGNSRTYYVTGHELEAAVELGLLRKGWRVMERITFKNSINFGEYILTHHRERQEAKKRGDKADTLFRKLLMNSLYGKFGADPRRYRNHIIVPGSEAPVDDPKFLLAGYVGPWALVENSEALVHSRFYNVATAASITGAERAAMMRGLHKVYGKMYGDTDGIAAQDVSRIKLGHDLGDWEIDDRDYYRWAIAGRKIYAFFYRGGEPCKCCGVRAKHASKGVKLTPDEIVRVAQGETIEYDPKAPTFSVLKPPSFTRREVSMT